MAKKPALDSEWIRRVIRQYDAGRPSRDDLRRVLAEFRAIADRQKLPTSAFPMPMLHWLSKGIERYLIAEDESLGKCLGLEEQGRSGSIDTDDAHLEIACQVDAELARGGTQEEAFEEVAARHHRRSTREIERAYRKYWYLAWAANEVSGIQRDPRNLKQLAKKFAKLHEAMGASAHAKRKLGG